MLPVYLLWNLRSTQWNKMEPTKDDSTLSPQNSCTLNTLHPYAIMILRAGGMGGGYPATNGMWIFNNECAYNFACCLEKKVCGEKNCPGHDEQKARDYWVLKSRTFKTATKKCLKHFGSGGWGGERYKAPQSVVFPTSVPELSRLGGSVDSGHSRISTQVRKLQ